MIPHFLAFWRWERVCAPLIGLYAVLFGRQYAVAEGVAMDASGVSGVSLTITSVASS